MYTLVYYVKETEGSKVFEHKYVGEEFRMRNNALHYLREIVKDYYINEGYATENIVSGLNCYKSEKTNKGDRKIMETRIKVEKI